MKRLSGFRDILFDKYWDFFYKILPIAKKYGFSFIDFPVVENQLVFFRSLGNSTDIISKELFSFIDKDNQKVCLRPEITAQVARYVLNNGLSRDRIAYFSSCFRRESPQLNRYRQFYQIGFEIIGNNSFLSDLDCLFLVIEIFDLFKIKYSLEINNIGNAEDRKKYSKDLLEFFKDKNLSENAKKKLEKNPLLILDSKEDLFNNLPSIENYVNHMSKKNFQLIKEELNKENIKYTVNSKLVRGLDYYSDLVFEFKSNDVTICGGGRYDGLIYELSEKKINIPAVGCALGLDRILNQISLEEKKKNLLITKETFDYNILKDLRNKYDSVDFYIVKKIDTKKYSEYDKIFTIKDNKLITLK